MTPHGISYREALRVWTRIALQSFGGPAGQIAVMHRILVEEKRWIGEERFLHALNYCMLLPGPEAQQLATYVGWLLHGYRGGLTAGILFVLPGFLAILVLSLLYTTYRDVGAVAALLFGLKAAVLAVVIDAVRRIGKRVLKNRAMFTIAALAFVAIFFFEVPFPVIVVGAGILGFAGEKLRPDLFRVIRAHGATAPAQPALLDGIELEHTRPSRRKASIVLAIGLLLWFLPLAFLAALGEEARIYLQEGVFFSQAAVVTFGGAYAVLAYIGQAAVERFGWLEPGEMLDGLGMAETTPGPLIQVVQFVGYLGAYRQPGSLHPMLAGLLGSIVTTWVTYVPCFLWIFLGAPFVERLRGKQGLTSALSSITAAVVGVVLNLALWFALHFVFRSLDPRDVGGARVLVPVWSSVDVAALLLSAAACVAMLRFKVGMLPTLGASALAGLLLRGALGA